MRADAGMVISASHNPYQDNGIKIFSRDGFKLPDAEEDEIEELITSGRIKDIRPDGRRHRQSPPHRRRHGPLHRVLQEHLPGRPDAWRA